MSLNEAMKNTHRGLRRSTRGGYFYFISDTQGHHAVLLINGKVDDSTGKQTFRRGRKLLRTFRSEKKKVTVFNRGRILYRHEGALLIVDRGTATMSTMKLSLIHI